MSPRIPRRRNEVRVRRCAPQHVLVTRVQDRSPPSLFGSEMTTMIRLNRVRAIAGVMLSTMLTLPAVAYAQAQSAVITGRVMNEFGQPIDQANVYINELTISVATNAQGNYS